MFSLAEFVPLYHQAIDVVRNIALVGGACMTISTRSKCNVPAYAKRHDAIALGVLKVKY